LFAPKALVKETLAVSRVERAAAVDILHEDVRSLPVPFDRPGPLMRSDSPEAQQDHSSDLNDIWALALAQLSEGTVSGSMLSEDALLPVNVDAGEPLLEESPQQGGVVTLANRWIPILVSSGICLAWGSYLLTDSKERRKGFPGLRLSGSERVP